MRYIPKYQKAGKLPILPAYNHEAIQDNVKVQFPQEDIIKKEEQIARGYQARLAEKEKSLQEHYNQPNLVSGMKQKPNAGQVKYQATQAVAYNDKLRNDPVGTLGPDVAMSLIPELLLLKGPSQAIGKGLNYLNPFKGFNPIRAAGQDAKMALKLEDPKYLNKYWRRSNIENSFSFTEDPISYMIKAPSSIKYKNAKRHITDIESKEDKLFSYWDKMRPERDSEVSNLLNLKFEKLNADKKALQSYRTDLKKKYQSAGRKQLKFPVEFNKPLGDGAFGTAYPVKGVDKVWKLGKVPYFETDESLKLMTKVGRENTNPNLGIPFSIHKFDDTHYGQLMHRVPGERITPDMVIPQTAIDEIAKSLETLRSKGVHFDYYNPQNLLFDVNTKKLSAVDFNSTPPIGDLFDNKINVPFLYSKDIFEDRFLRGKLLSLNTPY